MARDAGPARLRVLEAEPEAKRAPSELRVVIETL